MSAGRTEPPSVQLVHWTHPRLPASHPLADRWTLVFERRPLLTFGSESAATRAAIQRGWRVETAGGF